MNQNPVEPRLSGAGGLRALFEPRTIAVVGASLSPTKLGSVMLRSLASFPGEVYPIHPREPLIALREAYPRVSDVPVHVDLAILAVSASAVPDVLKDCALAGVGAAIICSGGFAEAGEQGRLLQNQVRDLVREAHIRLLGPNTSGFFNPESNVRASFVPGIEDIRPGPLGIIAQSGGVNHTLAFLAHNDGMGLSLSVGLGNAIDVGFMDMLDYLASEPQTRAIALHIEGVADGRALFEAVKRVTPRVPVIALKAGRADVSDFASSHTGTLTGNWKLTRSALVQAGAVVVEDTQELIDAARAFCLLRLPPSTRPGVAVVTSQAGPGLLVTDLLRSSEVSVPMLSSTTQAHLRMLLPPLTLQSNPVDTGRPDEAFGKVMAAVGSDPSIEAIVAYALQEPDALDPVAAIETARAQDRDFPPIVFATGGLKETLEEVSRTLQALHVPVYTSPERAARVMRALVADARAAARMCRVSAAGSPEGSGGTRRLGPEPLDEDAAKQLLAELGVRLPRRVVCGDHAEARKAFAELRHPVVVKVLDAAITHKSDVGGVYLHVDTIEALEQALAGIDRLTEERRVRYLVEEMVSSGLELIVGGSRDASFGPTVLLGLGGVIAEVVNDVALRVAPLTSAEAADMLNDLAARSLLDGYRGQPGVDREELINVLLAVSQLFVDHPEIAEMDINPLRATTEGLFALDALIILREEPAQTDCAG